MSNYLTTFPVGEDWRYLRDRENLIDQYADSLKIFLDSDIEDLLFEGKSKEAYEKLCSKFPELIVKRIQMGKETAEDVSLLNSTECTCIRHGSNLFRASDGVTPDYFIVKANTVTDPKALRALQEDELGRLYYLDHPEEFDKAVEILESYGLLPK
jgi:hypothetical protein